MIELLNIRKTYPDGTVALRGLDLAFGEGMLGLLGPNGAGKTTLLSILVLALEPSSGERRYFGIDDHPRNRGRIRGMIGYTLLTRGERDALERRDTLLRRARRLDPPDARLVRTAAYGILGPEGDPLPPQVDFDVLFIPDSHDKIVLIAPQLTFHESGSVNLMGPSGWNHPDLVSIGRNHVRGAVLTALFHEQSKFPFVAEFSRNFLDTFGASPDVFAAHGYDAARLVMAQLHAGEGSRKDVRNGILRTQAFPGASGVINMAPDGNAQKRPFLLMVRGGRLVSLD